MSCYCGCGTRGNQIRWTLGILLMLLGVGFLIGTIVSLINAYNDYVDCLDELVDDGYITKKQRDDAKDNNAFTDEKNEYIDDCMEDHIRSGNPAGTFFWLMVGFFIAGSVQFYIMCCCAKSPEQMQYGGQQQQQIYVAQPYAQQPNTYGGQPSYGEPVYYTSNVQMTKVYIQYD